MTAAQRKAKLEKAARRKLKKERKKRLDERQPKK